MARVSKKKRIDTKEAFLEPLQRTYQTAVYVRLSVEDSGKESTESIELQQFMAEEFVKRQKDMKLFGAYVDNGFTGTNFNRPAFEKMMDDVKERKIDCIVVKDLSRFGRNYVEAGYYLEKIFPYLDVRFIAISDGYDTLKNNSGDDMVASLKNIVNGLVSKDISSKVSSVMKQKQLDGEFIGAFAPYGYMKNPDRKNHLIVDPVSAPIVKEIFNLKLEGAGFNMIARKLNERGLPSPLLYNYQSGRYKMKKMPTGNSTMWNNTMVKQIIENFTYTGNVTQGKRKKSLCNGMPTTDLDKSEHIIVYGTHEAIIDEATFRALEQMIDATSAKHKAQRGKYPLTENIFKGKVFCGDCGNLMIRVKNVTEKGRVHYNHRCKTYVQNLNACNCTRKNVREGDLQQAILTSLKLQVKLTFVLEDKLLQHKKSKQYKSTLSGVKREFKKVEKAIEKNLHLASSLFERYNDGTLSLVDYTKLKDTYQNQLQELEQEKHRLLQAITIDETLLSAQNEWIVAFRQQKNTSVLTRELIETMIDKIIVTGYSDLEIIWRFSDSFALLVELLGGVSE